MDTKLQCIIILTAAILGISTNYWLQAAINNERTVTVQGQDFKFDNFLGVNWDNLTFGTCVVTSVLSLHSIALIMKKNINKLFGKLSFGLAVILCILWIACLIVYATRKSK